MHFLNTQFFCFINSFDKDFITNLPKKISIIYRNYDDPINEKLIMKIKNECKKKKYKFYLSNNIKLAMKLDLDGVYIPAFNKDIHHNTFSLKKKFTLIGSAHNLREIREKEKQNVSYIFLSPLFLKKKKVDFLCLYRFLNLKRKTYKKVVCLGGINLNNIKKTKLLNIDSIAAISLFNEEKIKYL